MKLNWKIIKIAIALVIIVGLFVWAIDYMRPDSFSGTSLSFPVGHGTVIVTNPSNVPQAAQITSNGTRTFRVVSSIEGMPSSSTRQGSGSNSSQLLDFELAQGMNEFTVTGGTDVNFVATSQNTLEASVQNLSEIEARAFIIVLAGVILGLLFYISRTLEHPWMRLFRQEKPILVPMPAIDSESSQGKTKRSYGDNRK